MQSRRLEISAEAESGAHGQCYRDAEARRVAVVQLDSAGTWGESDWG